MPRIGSAVCQTFHFTSTHTSFTLDITHTQQMDFIWMLHTQQMDFISHHTHQTPAKLEKDLDTGNVDVTNSPLLVVDGGVFRSLEVSI